MIRSLRPGAILLCLFTLLTGVAYPLTVTVLAQLAFPAQARGSLIQVDGRVVGSELIGQSFDDPRYFWGRPSATASVPYDAAASSGSNWGPTHPALVAAVRDRASALRASALRVADMGTARAQIPVDLVTASASGLDPHISPAAAFLQVSRVAQARSLPEKTVRDLVAGQVEGRSFGFLGEPRANVLRINLALDKLAAPAGTP